MALQDKTITIRHADTKVLGLSIVPKADGSITLSVGGTSKDSNGNVLVLEGSELTVQPGQVAVIDNLLARALIELRKKNGLET